MNIRQQECARPRRDLVRDQFMRRAVDVLDLKIFDLKNATCASNKCTVKDIEGTMTPAQKNAWIARFEQLKKDNTESIAASSVNQATYLRLSPSFMTQVDTTAGTSTSFSLPSSNVLSTLNDALPALTPEFSKVFKSGSFYDALQASEAVADSCGQRWAIADMLEKTDLRKAAQTPICSSPTQSSPEVEEMGKLAHDLTSALKQQMSGDINHRFMSVLQILAPACQAELEQSKEQIKDMRCKFIALDDATGSYLGGKTIVDKLGTRSRANPEAIRRTASQETLNALCEGKAVGVDVCTGFMTQDFAVDTHFCKNPIPGVPKHGYHAMTIVAFDESPQGGNRFLVQNSWGAYCNFEGELTSDDPAKKLKHIECEKDANGRSTGRFWVDEALLWNNTTNINIVQTAGAK